MSSLVLQKDKIDGLTAWRLENDHVALVVFPELGGKIYDLIYKPLNQNILWHNEQVPLSKVEFGSTFDEVFMGGWDELFPNDEEAVFNDSKFPDHGEFWSIPWHCEPEQSEGEVNLRLSATGPVTGVRLEKRIRLNAGEPDKIHFWHRLEHRGSSAFPFLWKLHPSFRISPDHRIDLPANRMKLDFEYSSVVDTDEAEFEWPTCRDRKGNQLDMRIVPPQSAGSTLFSYGTGLKEGWFALTDRANDLGFAFRFSEEVFPTCWLFASFGGWQSHYCLLIEPCSGYPYRLEDAVRMKTCPFLQPGQSIEFESVGTFYRGLTEVSGVSRAGQVL